MLTGGGDEIPIFKGGFTLAKFMQNSAMATPPDKSKSADFFLDPLPVPEATESNTDTAWGLWENTLRAHEDEAQKDAPPDFQDTLPADSTQQTKKP